MRRDDDFDLFADAFGEEGVLPATIAPVPDDMFDMFVLMLLEAGVITDEQLPGLNWENLPDLPQDQKPEDQAQNLAYIAYDLCFEDPESAGEIARNATEIDPLCIDAAVAYWFTCDIEAEEALEAAATSVVRGQALIDGTADERFVQDLWQYPRMRGAVRAYAALALTNWRHDLRTEAIDAAEEALRLAPGDGVGLSPHLANWYLATGQTKKAHRLLRDISDAEFGEFAPIPYARALVEFVRNGPDTKARSKLLRAAEAHPFIMLYLGSEKDGLMERPDQQWPMHTYAPGGFEEPIVWYTTIVVAWEANEGALDWAQMCFQDRQFRMVLEPVMAEFIEAAEDLGLVDELEDDDDSAGPELRLL